MSNTNPFIWTGVGSRSAADDNAVMLRLEQLSTLLTINGGVLRSGGADGADDAFETGWNNAWFNTDPYNRTNMKCEIFLPWKGFNGHSSPLYTSDPHPKALEIASQIHPKWSALALPVKKLHARNIHQVLGENLDQPSDIVVCWTPEGETKGGTRTAIVCAEQNGIPVVNVGGIAYDVLEVEEIADQIMGIVKQDAIAA